MHGGCMRAVIFDFDYTLGDTTEGILACISYGLEGLGFPAAGREEMRRTIGLSLPATLERLTGCDDPGKGRGFTKLFMEKADEVMVDSAELFPETVPLLRSLKARGVKTAIVTTKARFRIEGILEKYGVGELVDVIVGSDMVKNEKPHPEALELALGLMNISAWEAVYIGDNTVDARCAESAGVPFAGVLTGTTGAREMEEYPHICICSDLSELRRTMSI